MDDSVRSLLQLPSHLIGRLWPEEVVLLGRRVCKHLHSELLDHVPVLLLENYPGVPSVERATELLSQVARTSCALHFRWCGDVALLAAVVSKAGAGKRVTRIGLRNANLRAISAAEALRSLAKDCAQLGWLDLTNNSFPIDSLSGFLAECKSLTSLNLKWTDLGAGGAAKLAPMLRQLTGLAHLDLSANSLGDRGASSVAQMLEQSCSLTALDIEENAIEGRGADRLIEALGKCTGIAHLSLNENEFGEQRAAELARALLPSASALTTLELSGINAGPGGGTALASTMRECSQLELLNLSLNKMGDEGVEQLASALAGCQHLTALDVMGNRLTQPGIAALGSALGASNQLSSLSLSFCTIGVGGAAALAGLLQKATALKELKLADAHIDAEGAKHLAEALRGCKHLTYVDASYNNMADMTVGFAQALSHCSALRHLNMIDKARAPELKVQLQRVREASEWPSDIYFAVGTL